MNITTVVTRSTADGVRHITITEEAFLAMWRLMGGKPDDPFAITTVNFTYYPPPSPVVCR